MALETSEFCAKDVFISYASEDKPIADLLAKEFDNYAIDYWMDIFEIGWGEKIIRKIDEGLSSSRYVVVIISETFLAKRWTVAELDAALTHEIEGDILYVLPIMVTGIDLFKREFPILAARKYMSWSQGPQKIAEDVSMMLGREFRESWVFHHPAQHVGTVWIKMRAKKEHSGLVHKFEIRWGPWTRGGQQVLVHNGAVALMHTKGDDGLSIPIFFEIHPECYVSFGQGEPINVDRVNLNKWWVQFSDQIRLWVAEKLLWSR